MPEDYEVKREVWESKIPVQFTLALEEITSTDQPRMYCLLVPRVSYFPLVTEKLQKYFLTFVDSEEVDEMWLEYNGVPLKWHYPVGVLYDLYAINEAVPWQLTVHFKRFPESEILRCPNRDVVESHFMSTVKEADQIKHRGDIINTMQKKDHKQLWSGLMNDRLDQFLQIHRKLMENSSEFPLRHVPVRIYKHDQTFVQKLCKAYMDDSTEPMSLINAFNKIVPELSSSSNAFRIVTHGVELPHDTHMMWLCENMAYPDNFLHICLVAK